MIFHSFLLTSLFSSALPWDILGTKLAGGGGGRGAVMKSLIQNSFRVWNDVQ